MRDGPRSEGAGAPKLAQTTADAIERQIRADGWPVGVSLGTEADLMRRYNISRATFREAVRILESNLVASMRPGPGGGLMVIRPDSEVVTAAMARQLDFEQVAASEVFETRAALELTCLDLVLARLDDEGRERLREAMEREEPSSCPSADWGHGFHLLLAQLTGNRAMVLFLEILTRMSEGRFRSIPASDEQMLHMTSEAHRAHARITESILAGDAVAARDRLRAHLEATRPYWSATWSSVAGGGVKG